MSPALLVDGVGEGIRDRYGKLVGIIDQPGLADPSERLVYVNPAQRLAVDDPTVTNADGFGDPQAIPEGTPINDDQPEWSLQILVFGLLVAPALALALVAARTGSHQRDRRTALVTALGGRGIDRLWLSFGEAAAI